MGLESISEPDIDMPEDDEDEFSDAQDHVRSRSASPDTSLPSAHSKFAEEGDTEEDPVDPITPGAGRSSFVNIIPPEVMQKSNSTGTTDSSGVDSLSFDDEDDVEWVAHDVMTPQQEYTRPAAAYDDDDPLAESQATIGARASHESGLGAEHGRHKRKAGKKKHAKAPPQQYPFPATPGGDDTSKSPPRRVPQMRTAKARDGGRTQSGGVRGVPADDIDDF